LIFQNFAAPSFHPPLLSSSGLSEPQEEILIEESAIPKDLNRFTTNLLLELLSDLFIRLKQYVNKLVQFSSREE
jgi:hypothetical protein